MSFIVLDGAAQAFKCLRCGFHGEALPFPLTPYELVKLGKIFKKLHAECKKENCLNCKHLEFRIHEGYLCFKREDGLEDRNLTMFVKNLQVEKYRKRQKACFVEKTND